MDKTCGSVLGGDEIFLLCDKVQKGENIRFDPTCKYDFFVRWCKVKFVSLVSKVSASDGGQRIIVGLNQAGSG